jgi:hypothetical protein
MGTSLGRSTKCAGEVRASGYELEEGRVVLTTESNKVRREEIRERIRPHKVPEEDLPILRSGLREIRGGRIDLPALMDSIVYCIWIAGKRAGAFDHLAKQ